MGFVGGEPDVRYPDHNFTIADFSLATGFQSYTASDGRIVEGETDWHRIVTTNEHARWVERYVHKGTALGVEGRLRYRSYTDKQGETRQFAEIVADKLFFVGSSVALKSSESKHNQNLDDLNLKGFTPDEDSEPF